jgi:hypothetical protein
VPRTIFAFNGDLESWLALHWLVHERGYEAVSLSINLVWDVRAKGLGKQIGGFFLRTSKHPGELREAGTTLRGGVCQAAVFLFVLPDGSCQHSVTRSHGVSLS